MPSNTSSGSMSLGADRRLCRSKREPTGEHAEPVEDVPFAWREQVVAPVDGLAQCPVAFHRGAAAASEQPEALVETGRDLVGTHHAGAGRRELDGERDSVQPPADLGDRGRGLRVELEVTARLLGALDEELHRVCGEDSAVGARPRSGAEATAPSSSARRALRALRGRWRAR